MKDRSILSFVVLSSASLALLYSSGGIRAQPGSGTTIGSSGGASGPTGSGNGPGTGSGTGATGGTGAGTGTAASEPPAACKYEYVVDAPLADGYRQLRDAKEGWLPKDAITRTGVHDDALFLVIGPDGKQRGITPSSVRESTKIYVIAYSPNGEAMEVSTAGCDRLATRVLGDAPAVKFSIDTVSYSAALYSLGKCNADKQVSITTKTSKASNCGSSAITLQTAPVYNFTVGYGAAFFPQNRTEVGVDVGAGGTPNTAFSRDSMRGLQSRVIVGWFPGGYSSDLDLLSGRRVFAGTALDPESGLSSFNLHVGYQPVTGFALFAGMEFCGKREELSAGLMNGSVFTDDSSKLPTKSEWSCDGHLYLGATVTIDLLGKLLKR